MDSKLGREISRRPIAEQFAVRIAPGFVRGHILLPPAIGRVDPGMQNGFRSPLIQLLRRNVFQQHNGVVRDFRPEGSIDLAEYLCNFRLPAPPEILTQFRQFRVKRFLLRHKNIPA